MSWTFGEWTDFIKTADVSGLTPSEARAAIALAENLKKLGTDEVDWVVVPRVVQEWWGL